MRSLVLIALFFIPAVFCGRAASENGLYGPVGASDYLTGRFDPAAHPLFVDLASLKIPADGRKHYLRKEAATALRDLIAAFRKDHPKAEFFVRSSTRTFRDQKKIWEDKYTGATLVCGRDLSKSVRDPRARALEILRYSSMPGTSRHHWGTDVDINDLANRYFDRGDGKILYDWLRVNATRFGFCMPYTAGRKHGYREERWHWSYAPLSRQFTRQWLELSGKKIIISSKGVFAGSETCGDLAPQYVSSVSESCR